MKRTKLSSWEKLAITEALRELVEKGRLHQEHGRELLDKLENSSAVIIEEKD